MAAGGYFAKLTNEQMRDTVDKLKRIEEKASAVMGDVNKKRATLNSRAYAEIDRRKARIKRGENRELDGIRERTAELTEAKSAQIRREYEDKKKNTAELFSANRDAWRKTIVDNILAGI